jgi:hypothetical protein
MLGRILQFFCKHRMTVLRWDDEQGRLYVSCLNCPYDSPGVLMGGGK